MVALQAAHHGGAEFAGEIRVLAKRLLAAAPARVAKDIDVGRPEGEALILAAVAGGDGGVVLGAGLVGDHAGNALHERAIPRRAKPDDLRKHRGATVAPDAVAGFAPPVVGGHAQTLDRVVLVHQLVDFLGQRQIGQQCFNALRYRQTGVEMSQHRRTCFECGGSHGTGEELGWRQIIRAGNSSADFPDTPVCRSGAWVRRVGRGRACSGRGNPRGASRSRGRSRCRSWRSDP